MVNYNIKTVSVSCPAFLYMCQWTLNLTFPSWIASARLDVAESPPAGLTHKKKCTGRVMNTVRGLVSLCLLFVHTGLGKSRPGDVKSIRLTVKVRQTG